MPILGLVTTESDSSWRYKNNRRRVFYQYPNGKSPLLGILSLLPEEETNDPEFNWNEQRYVARATTTASSGASKGPFTDTSGTVLTDPAPITRNTSYRMYVSDLAPLKVGDVFSVRCNIDTTDQTGTTEVRGLITEKIDGASKYVTFIALSAHSSTIKNRPQNGTTNENVGNRAIIVGQGFEQGSVGPTAEYFNLPLAVGNYCQILRTPFSLTGTALKTSLKFDETGPYKHKAKEHSIQHMTEFERALFFNSRTKTTGLQGLPLFTFGGILWFLEQWEMAGSVAEIKYRGASAAQITGDTDDNKRIIENASGVITEKTFDGYVERAFRTTNNSTNEKLVFCGNGALNVVNQMYKGKAVLQSGLPMSDTYGMDVVKHVSPFGTMYYKTHPLFNEDSNLRNCMLILDVNNLVYRYLAGRDTQLLKNRQNNGDDFRRDEWLTEAGFELRYPESHMFIKNIQSYAP